MAKASSSSSQSSPKELDASVQEAIERLQNAVVENDAVVVSRDTGCRTDSVKEQMFLECELFKSTVKKAADEFRQKLQSIESCSRSGRSRFQSKISSESSCDFDSESEDYFTTMGGSLINSVAGLSVFSSLSGESTSASNSRRESLTDRNSIQANTSQVMDHQREIQHEQQPSRSASKYFVHETLSQNLSDQQQNHFDTTKSSKAHSFAPKQVLVPETVPRVEVELKSGLELDLPLGKDKQLQWVKNVTCAASTSCPLTPLALRKDDAETSTAPSPVARDYSPVCERGPCSKITATSPKVVAMCAKTKSCLEGNEAREGSSTAAVQTVFPLRARLLKSPPPQRRIAGSTGRTRLGSDSNATNTSTLLEDAKLAMEQLCYRADQQLFHAVLDKILNIGKTRISNSSNEFTEIVSHFFKLLVTYPKFVYHGAALCYRVIEDPVGGEVFLNTVLRQSELEVKYVLKLACTVPLMDRRLLGLIWFLAELHWNLIGDEGKCTRNPKLLALAIADLLRTLLDIRRCPFLVSNLHCAIQVLKITAPCLTSTSHKSIEQILGGLETLRLHCKKLEMCGQLSVHLKKALVYISLHIQLINSRILKKVKTNVTAV